VLPPVATPPTTTETKNTPSDTRQMARNVRLLYYSVHYSLKTAV